MWRPSNDPRTSVPSRRHSNQLIHHESYPVTTVNQRALSVLKYGPLSLLMSSHALKYFAFSTSLLPSPTLHFSMAISQSVILVTGGTGLVGYAIQHVINSEPVGSRFGRRAGEAWVFIGSKDADLRYASHRWTLATFSPL